MEPGVRINKYLADLGVATRLGADVLVKAGKVRINGVVAKLGDKVLPGSDVQVAAARPQRARRYFIYHKPRGIITHSPQHGEDDVVMSLPPELKSLGLFPLGRLDKDSSGLMLLTNDGRLTERLLKPESNHEKEYTVRVKEPLPKDFKRRMEGGVYIEGYTTKPCIIRVLGAKTFSIILTEGKKHQIRRMVASLGNQVDTLQRVRILALALGALPEGSARELTGDELASLLGTLNLSL